MFRTLDDGLDYLEKSADPDIRGFARRVWTEYGSFEQIDRQLEELEDYQERSEATVEDLTTRLTEEWEVTAKLKIRLCAACKIIMDMRDEKFPERFRETHKFGPDYEWVTTDLAQFKHLAPDMEDLIAAFTRGKELWIKQGGESLYERVR